MGDALGFVAFLTFGVAMLVVVLGPSARAFQRERELGRTARDIGVLRAGGHTPVADGGGNMPEQVIVCDGTTLTFERSRVLRGPLVRQLQQTADPVFRYTEGPLGCRLECIRPPIKVYAPAAALRPFVNRMTVAGWRFEPPAPRADSEHRR